MHTHTKTLFVSRICKSASQSYRALWEIWGKQARNLTNQSNTEWGTPVCRVFIFRALVLTVLKLAQSHYRSLPTTPLICAWDLRCSSGNSRGTDLIQTCVTKIMHFPQEKSWQITIKKKKKKHEKLLAKRSFAHFTQSKLSRCVWDRLSGSVSICCSFLKLEDNLYSTIL